MSAAKWKFSLTVKRIGANSVTSGISMCIGPICFNFPGVFIVNLYYERIASSDVPASQLSQPSGFTVFWFIIVFIYEYSFVFMYIGIVGSRSRPWVTSLYKTFQLLFLRSQEYSICLLWILNAVLHQDFLCDCSQGCVMNLFTMCHLAGLYRHSPMVHGLE